MKKTRLWVLLTLSIALSACAPVTKQIAIDQSQSEAEKEKQRELALREQLKRQLRVMSVAHNILEQTAPLCGDKTIPSFGMSVTTKDNYRDEMQKAAGRLWGVSETATVLFVLPGQPADLAGIKPGDKIVAVASKTFSNGKEADAALHETAKTSLKENKPVSLTIRRAGKDIPLTVNADKVCDYSVELQNDDQVNAFADGNRIIITTGMIRFAENDDELALVLGHELAHNTMGHLKKQMGNRLIGTLLGAIILARTGVDVTRAAGDIGGMAFSQEFEAEADYVGLYYAARAGYDVNSSPSFWRKMAVEHPRAIGHGSSHPDTASRFLSLEKAAQEIAQKRAANVALVPEYQGEPPKPSENSGGSSSFGFH